LSKLFLLLCMEIAFVEDKLFAFVVIFFRQTENAWNFAPLIRTGMILPMVVGTALNFLRQSDYEAW
jgi:hypothetical protein